MKINFKKIWYIKASLSLKTGDVHPKTSPGDSGFAWGTVISGKCFCNSNFADFWLKQKKQKRTQINIKKKDKKKISKLIRLLRIELCLQGLTFDCLKNCV